MSGRVDGDTAIVTSAAQGVGKAVARELGEEVLPEADWLASGRRRLFGMMRVPATHGFGTAAGPAVVLSSVRIIRRRPVDHFVIRNSQLRSA